MRSGRLMRLGGRRLQAAAGAAYALPTGTPNRRERQVCSTCVFADWEHHHQHTILVSHIGAFSIDPEGQIQLAMVAATLHSSSPISLTSLSIPRSLLLREMAVEVRGVSYLSCIEPAHVRCSISSRSCTLVSADRRARKHLKAWMRHIGSGAFWHLRHGQCD